MKTSESKAPSSAVTEPGDAPIKNRLSKAYFNYLNRKNIASYGKHKIRIARRSGSFDVIIRPKSKEVGNSSFSNLMEAIIHAQNLETERGWSFTEIAW